jgi:ADP-ribose pyrophosphatase YjhB (NUDIX family)
MMRFLLRVWRWLPLSDGGRWRWWLTWGLTQKFLVGVMAVVFDDQGQILLLNHTYRRDHPWGLPSGWLKAKENPAAAMVREVAEETGLHIQVTQPLIIGGNEDWPRVDLVFACRCAGGVFRPSAEVSEGGFFKLTALPEAMAPYQRRLIDQAASLLLRREATASELPG